MKGRSLPLRTAFTNDMSSIPPVTPCQGASFSAPSVLLTGATGYIGGRLVPVLESAGVRLRCLARRPAALAPRVSPTTEVVAGDLARSGVARSRARGRRRGLLPGALDGRARRLPGKDRLAARNFGEAARRAGVRRIVYLGGLATGEETLSKHLKSRIETGQVLRESGVPVVEFRASVVIGSGQPVVRADSGAGRTFAGHDLPAVGLDPGAADRHRRPAGVSGGRASTFPTARAARSKSAGPTRRATAT